MNWLRFTLPVLALLGGAVLTPHAQEASPSSDPSVPRPKPKWLQIVDQGENDPRLKGYLTPAGIKMEVVADSPVVTNPVGLTFAEDGTLYVLEWLPEPKDSSPQEHTETFRFKDGSVRQVTTLRKPVKDHVKVLRASKGTGTYDEAKVILEDEMPSGMLLHDGWLYIAGRGTVRRYKQSKADGPYDVQEVIAQGFCDHGRNQVSGLTLGNDGWLYLTAAEGDNVVEGSDGSRATVLRSGAVFRCRPDGSHLEVYSIGFRNPHGNVSFDRAGNLFHADNDDGTRSKYPGWRLLDVAEGSDFGWRLAPHSNDSIDPVRAGAFDQLPGKMPPLRRLPFGWPGGLLIDNDTRFPEHFRGLLFAPDFSHIQAYRVEPRGASFAVVEEFEFLKSNDARFRPCQMVLGPDGALYVCDCRSDVSFEGQVSGDGKQGRIYRLSWGGTQEEPAIPLRKLDSWSKIAQLDDEELVKALSNPDLSDRQRAQRELVRRGEKERPALLKVLDDTEQSLPARLAALGALQAFWNEEVEKSFIRQLNDQDPDVRRLAADGLALHCEAGDKDAHDALLQVLGDEKPAVRRAVFLAMGRINAAGAPDALVNCLSFDDGQDVFLRDGLVRAIERTGAAGVERLIALAESGVEKDLEKVVETFAAFRTREGAEGLPALLRNPHLNDAQRTTLVRSYGNYLLDPPLDLQPLLDYMKANPDAATPLKLAAVQVLSAGGVKAEQAPEWLTAQLDDHEEAVRLEAIHALVAIHADRAVPRLVKLLGDASLSTKERIAAVKALRRFKDRLPVRTLVQILKDGQPSHPEKPNLLLECFRTLAVLDLSQGQEVARSFLKTQDARLLSEAVQVLGRNAAGARELGQLFLDGKLPRSMADDVEEALAEYAPKDSEAARLLKEVRKAKDTRPKEQQ